MADRLTVTELDFDTIKKNLKTFLNQQSEFTDYDFEGSGLNILIDLLAYNTHYNAYYLNMVANEAFLDTALLRDSVVSHAKTLGYVPHSKSASVATINFTAQSSSNSSGSLTIPSGFSFLSNQIDNTPYNFVVLNDTIVSKANSQYFFENLNIYEGQLLTYVFNHDQASNPKQVFTLSDENIDTTTIKVSSTPTAGNTQVTVHKNITDILDVTATSEVFYLQENKSGKFQIYFGNDIIGKKLPDGAVISVTYLVTNAAAANKANNFVATATLVDSVSESINNFTVTPVSASTGGTERESVDKIKLGATTQFTSQNRLVTKGDYSSYISKNYPNADSISVWGGEEQPEKAYGKIYLSIKPKNEYSISEAEKRRIINDIIAPKIVIGTKVEIINPIFLFLKINAKIKYNKNKTIRTQNTLAESIRSAILLYKENNINKFNATFALSKIQNEIDLVDGAILGSETTLRLQKRFEPNLNKTASYVINFNSPLHRGTLLNRLVSSEFRISDGTVTRVAVLEESPQSFTGVEEIKITDPGFGFTSVPTVTITGDGTGATATATIVKGKIESIKITNRGVNYTQATVAITGGGNDAIGGTATAIVTGKIGTLRVIYYDTDSEKKIIKADAGTINYDTGIISINDIKIISLVSGSELKIDVQSEKTILESVRNNIITIDETDPSAITLDFEIV